MSKILDAVSFDEDVDEVCNDDLEDDEVDRYSDELIRTIFSAV